MNTFCTYYNHKICFSCTKVESSYPEQLSLKEQIVKDSLVLFSPYQQLATVSSALTSFRNKAKFSVTGTIEQPIIGLLGETQLDQGREILDCPIHVEEINSIAKSLKALIREARLPPYEIQSKRGEIKGIIIYNSWNQQETYVRLILRSKESIDRIKKCLPNWINSHPSVKCFSVNIQPIPHAILEGGEEIYLTDNHFITQQYPELSMFLTPKGFVQTNQAIARLLYLEAAEWVKSLSIKKFLELFCGQGAFSFFVSPYVTDSFGVEINSEAIEMANQTASNQQFSHLRFRSADAKDVETLVKDFAPELILVNPPRRGLAESIHLIKAAHCPYIIYSSCSLNSLSKDLTQLKDHYRIERLRIFDMFPHTEHFETLVLLKKIS